MTEPLNSDFLVQFACQAEGNSTEPQQMTRSLVHTASMAKVIEEELKSTCKNQKAANIKGIGPFRQNPPSEHRGGVCIVVLNLAVRKA